jgi:hypothetical protein
MKLFEFLASPFGRSMVAVSRYQGETHCELHLNMDFCFDSFTLRGKFRDVYFDPLQEMQLYGDGTGGGFTVTCSDKTIYRLVPFTLIPLA